MEWMNRDLVEVKIVFVKDRNSKNWLAVLSTNTDIGDEEIIRIYGKRWDIEVFFRSSSLTWLWQRNFRAEATI